MPPGLYINDGGETGSALSSAIAQIANNFSPKTQAEAEYLRQQMIGQKLTNQTSSDKLGALEGGLSGAGQLPSALGAEIGKLATSPGMSQGGMSPDGTGSVVAGAPAPHFNLATGILGAISQARLAAGGDFNDLRSGIEMGQQKNMGPANTYQAQGRIGEANAIADNASRNRISEAGAIAPIDVWKSGVTQRQTPYDIEAGKDHIIPPMLTGASGFYPAAPTPAPAGANVDANGNQVVKGPSLYDKTFSTGQADEDIKSMAALSNGRNVATQGINSINNMQTVFDQLGNESLGGRLSTAAQQLLLNRFGISVTNKGAALAELSNRITALMGPLHSSLGIQRVAQPEIALMKGALPNALQDPRVFHDVTNMMKANLMQEQQAGQIAKAVQSGRMSAADGRDAIDKVYEHDPMEDLKQQQPSLFNAAPVDSGGGGGPPDVDPKTWKHMTPEERKLWAQ